MTKQTINVGVTANDGSGDPIRIAFQKTNSNFNELYDSIDGISIPSNISELNNDVGFISDIPANIISNTITVDTLKIENGVHERFQEIIDVANTVTYDCDLGHVFYHATPNSNWVVNLTNFDISDSYASSVTLIILQGSTGYYPTALEINGESQTINWKENTIPTPSSNRIDVVSFSVLNNAGSYIVLGQLTGF